jgi:putative thioredoxin
VAAAPKPSSPPKWNPELDRRFLLERARSRQREYRLTDAERLYQQVLARAPRDSEALAGLGEVDVLRGTAAAADEHFQAALRVNADYIPALIAVADLKWESGRLKEAQQAYQSIVGSYDADLYPPYVAQRSTAPLPAQCGEQ